MTVRRRAPGPPARFLLAAPGCGPGGIAAAECKTVPPRERAACPLLGPAVAIRDLPDGVRVELARAGAIDATIAEMRCHYAFARTRGFSEEAAACPLYIRGIQIERSR